MAKVAVIELSRVETQMMGEREVTLVVGTVASDRVLVGDRVVLADEQGNEEPAMVSGVLADEEGFRLLDVGTRGQLVKLILKRKTPSLTSIAKVTSPGE